MSHTAFVELNAASDKLLNAQRTCAFCGEIFKSADWLALHIMRNHSKPHEYPRTYCDNYERFIILRERQAAKNLKPFLKEAQRALKELQKSL